MAPLRKVQALRPALALLLVLATGMASLGAAQAPTCCVPGDARGCWPDAAALAALEAQLDPQATRTLAWSGLPMPYPLAFPSLASQPLYGQGASGMRALYVQDAASGDADCLRTPASARSVFCKLTARNNPMNGWTPALIAWPLTDAHVQTLVHFANTHSLCVCVAGTGHDFLNRHSCPNGGLLIRTALLKQITWDLDDDGGVGHAAGTVRFGAGVVWHEAHQAASARDRVVVSGWATTVGVAGWTLGGGHGPFNPKYGLGADNLVQATLVTADASLVTASLNATDLLWALRGGGGSTWGVLTSLTVKAHPVPEGGFTIATGSWYGDLCEAGSATLAALVKGYLAWALERSDNFAGLFYVTTSYDAAAPCPGTWSVLAFYHYLGASTDPELANAWDELMALAPNGTDGRTTYDQYWTYFQNGAIERIITLNWLDPSPTSLGGLPSVLVPRDVVASGRMGEVLLELAQDCLAGLNCGRQEVYHDLTGQVGSPQEPYAAVSPGMRSAAFHFLCPYFAPDVFERTYYSLGAHSYMSESAYDMPNWPDRLWGAANYDRLLAIKRAVDPVGRFWCRHCVGDTSA